MAYEMRISDWSSVVCSSDLCQILRQLTAVIDVTAFPAPELVASASPRLSIGAEAAGLHHLDDQPVILRMLKDQPAAALRERCQEIGRASCRASMFQYV